MQIRQAQPQELAKVNEILYETAQWLQQKGHTQWSEILEGSDKHQLTQALAQQEVYFFLKEENIVGLAALWNQPSAWDQMLWRDKAGADATIYYIHRVAIRPKYRGQQLGAALLQAIKTHFADRATVLRLDCIADNPKLTDFYHSNGFSKVGYGENQQRQQFELLEWHYA